MSTAEATEDRIVKLRELPVTVNVTAKVVVLRMNKVVINTAEVKASLFKDKMFFISSIQEK